MSNEMLVTANQVLPSTSVPSRASIPSRKFTALRWVSIVPLGRPVLPEV
jgi:hypothetical protein